MTDKVRDALAKLGTDPGGGTPAVLPGTEGTAPRDLEGPYYVFVVTDPARAFGTADTGPIPIYLGSTPA